MFYAKFHWIIKCNIILVVVLLYSMVVIQLNFLFDPRYGYCRLFAEAVWPETSLSTSARFS